ncbi:tol-pal system protein YbgF [Parashewanella spongiae]|uniref:Cell division coordinator CpoB n=1 Tax=Parashewanella spongiae TaxID=342950 RepID=A0A3A6U0K4_9GAMM|nr:tol-pal system protein YbgF [Parashewanella spongiae]MCL1078560.1 tol-pal system protein YbgF [Parashewanella spongiae]RJY19017.1 tol-pal system protein YbgF [Parashewanella spongiae]
MKRAVTIAAIFLGIGAAHAAPSPVEDIAGGTKNDRVSRLERIIKARQQTEFEMQQRVSALQREVLDLRGLNEQQAYQLEQILQRQRQLYDEIAKLQTQQSTPVVTTKESNVSVTTPTGSLSETDSYQRAVNMVLKERKYEEAIPAFQEFIGQYPKSSYSANANYWLAQLLFNKGDLSKAKAAFQTVINKFPESGKSSDSMIKLGKIAEQQNDKKLAKRYYQRVVNEYQNSAAARVAKSNIARLKE